ncbi:hypothetical protein DL98DRAFT_579802 [Cadophora sp. DSE1049]|nr:hypothetical protein DL98DRAFT_579802 [Cadophora sp. DSE1049]
MSYSSQMPLMRTRAADDDIVVNEVLEYYRVSLLRAQVRLDLDLDGQQYVAEHQTWALFWPGEAFSGIDPRSQVQVTTREAASPATTPAAAVAQPEATTSSTILKDISTQPIPSIHFNKEPQPATPKRTQSSVDDNGSHSRNDEAEEERSKDQQSQENNRHREISRELPSGDNRNSDDDDSAHMSISPPTHAHAPNPEMVICGNCSEAGHSLADCTYNIDEYGYLNGCPRCNTLEHNYADCPAPKFSHDDYFYLVTKRHGKPPLRCRWDFRLGYWKKFKECVYKNDTTAMRPQTAAFAKDRRNRGVVQAWNEIVLDPIWYGRTDLTTNVGKMVHPLDKEWVNPYNRQVVDLSGDDGSTDGGSRWNGGKRSADVERGVDEYGRLRREDSSDVSMGDGSVQEPQGVFDGNQGIQRRSSKHTMQPWSRNGRSQGRQDESSWKKRRLEDQRMEQQNHENPFGLAGPSYGNDQGRQNDNYHTQNPGFQQQAGAGSNNASISSLSPRLGYHAGNGFGKIHTQQRGPRQKVVPQAEQQRPTPFQGNENPFPPIGPAQPPNGMTPREFGKQKANEARAKLGPIPGWKPRNTKMRNNNGQIQPSHNTGSGGFQRQRGNFSHDNSRNSTNSQKNIPQRSFDFRAGALPPTQPMKRPGMQVDGLRSQAALNTNGFGIQHGIAPLPLVTEGPISARIGGIMASRGQKNGDRKLDSQNGGQSNQQFSIGTGHGPGPGPQHQKPGRDTGGYCVNCRSHGHVIEECEGNCGLCRAGGHKARECRFFDLGAR